MSPDGSERRDRLRWILSRSRVNGCDSYRGSQVASCLQGSCMLFPLVRREYFVIHGRQPTYAS